MNVGVFVGNRTMAMSMEGRVSMGIRVGLSIYIFFGFFLL